MWSSRLYGNGNGRRDIDNSIMSDLFVDNIKHQSSQGSGTITLGTSGEKIDVASGATGNILCTDVAFAASKAASTQTVVTNTGTHVTLTKEHYDTASAYDTSTSTFTVPTGKGGKYLFTWGVEYNASISNLYTAIFINDNVVFDEENMYLEHGVAFSGQQSRIISISAGDTVKCYTYQSSGSNKSISNTRRTFFAGFRLNGA